MEEAKFKAFVLSDVDGKELLKNASVLHRVSKYWVLTIVSS